MNERYSSGTLGRPFALSDEAIEAPTPMEASYADLRALDFVNCNVATGDCSKPNAMSVFLFAVGLRRIQSANRAVFTEEYHSRPSCFTRGLFSCTPGLIVQRTQACLSQLEEWLSRRPKFVEPECTYHLPLWYSFMVEKEKLSVLRTALGHLSQLGVQSPKALLARCSASATQVIRVFAGLWDSRDVLPVRSYFQAIFVSGLSLMFCASGQCEPGVDGAEFEAEPKSDIAEILALCARVLSQLSQELPDSQTYYIAFELLRRKCAQDKPKPGQMPLPDLAGTTNRNNLQTLDAGLISQPPPMDLPGGLSTFDSNAALTYPGLYMRELDNDLGGMYSCVNDSLDWSDLFSEDCMEQMVADVGNYVWHLPMPSSFT